MKKAFQTILLAAFLSLQALAQDNSGLSSADAIRFIRPEYQPFSEMLATSRTQVPLLGNSLEVIRGMRKLDLMTKDIAESGSSLNFEYYKFWSGESEIRDMLMSKSQEGLDVRFISENIANMPFMADYFGGMRRSGVKLRMFTPAVRPLRFLLRMNNRNHQKIAVIDNRIGYIGGMNMHDEYFNEWKDTHIRIEGPAATVGCNGVFWKMWEESACDFTRPAFADTVSYPAADSLGKIVQIVADGPFNGSNLLEDSYVWLLDHTEQYFYARTPYFTPPRDVLRAMKAAARRGADVRIIVPAESDIPIMNTINRSYYKTLLKSGVRIFTSRGAFNHSKTFVTDDYVTAIGSTNLDYRSFRLNYEDNAYIYDAPVAGQMRGEFESDCQSICNEITLQDMNDLSLFQKILNGLARLISWQM